MSLINGYSRAFSVYLSDLIAVSHVVHVEIQELGDHVIGVWRREGCSHLSRLLSSPPALGKCRSGGGCVIVGHVFLQLPVSVSSRNKQGYAWLALHEVAAKRGPRSGILQLTHSYRRGSENCNRH